MQKVWLRVGQQHQVNFPLCLAPMVGLSHLALRRVIRKYLPEQALTLWPTEMLNSRRLPSEDLEKVPESRRDRGEQLLVPQILGNEEEPIRNSVKKLTDWGAHAIDINMGCPVEKALKHNYGVALMGDPKYAAKVVSMTRKSSSLPISVKLRAGLQNDRFYLQNFVDGIREAGADWITLHPRTAEQKRRGQADWGQVAWIKERAQIPVIGNGDIQCAADVFAMLNETGCDMVMSGRALAAKPWMVWQVAEHMGFPPPRHFVNERAPRTESEEARHYFLCLQDLLQNLIELYGVDLALRKFRFHVKTTSVWLEYGHFVWAQITGPLSVEDILSRIQGFLEQSHTMFERTELRQ